MDGTIAVESALGRGTTFAVVLKRSSVVLRLDATLRQEVTKHDAPSSTQPAVPLNIRVLLVEDHHSTREGTRRILVSEGATVLEAADGKTALRILREEEPDAILLDMMLPGLDGREVLRAIQADRPARLKCVLVLTGDLTAERLDEIKDLGADGLIPKPVDIRKIVAALRECIGR
jgi:CheY-like chemotaxis protein